MDCERTRELFTDRSDRTLGPILGAELQRHLDSCPECAQLWGDFERVVDLLHEVRSDEGAIPGAISGADLVRRVAAQTWTSRRRPTLGSQRLLLVAAALACIASSTLIWGSLAIAGGSAGRSVDRALASGRRTLARLDRAAEDLRVLVLVVETAFEARVENVEDRVQAYRALLEKRREGARQIPAGKTNSGTGAIVPPDEASVTIGEPMPTIVDAGRGDTPWT